MAQVVLTVSISDTLRQALADIVARDGIKLSHATQAAITAGLTAQGELPATRRE
jgi:hypothetical protein